MREVRTRCIGGSEIVGPKGWREMGREVGMKGWNENMKGWSEMGVKEERWEGAS